MYVHFSLSKVSYPDPIMPSFRCCTYWVWVRDCIEFCRPPRPQSLVPDYNDVYIHSRIMITFYIMLTLTGLGTSTQQTCKQGIIHYAIMLTSVGSGYETTAYGVRREKDIFSSFQIISYSKRHLCPLQLLLTHWKLACPSWSYGVLNL